MKQEGAKPAPVLEPPPGALDAPVSEFGPSDYSVFFKRQPDRKWDPSKLTATQFAQVGLDLWDEVREVIRSGKQPTPVHIGALDEYVGMLMHLAAGQRSPDPAAPNPWRDLASDITADFLKVTEPQRDAEEYASRRGDYAATLAQFQEDQKAAFRASRQRDLGAPRPVQGLSREVDENPMVAAWAGRRQRKAGDITEITTDPEDVSRYYFPKDIGDRPLLKEWDNSRRISGIIYGNALETKEIDGKLRFTVSDGAGDEWDITDALQFWNQPKIRERLKKVMSGSPPLGSMEGQFGQSVAEAAVSTATGAHLADALGTFKAWREGTLNGPIRHVRTAMPALTLPWVIPFGDDGQLRGDEWDKLNDPLYARALWETVGRMQANNELAPGAWQTFLNGTAGLVELTRFGKLLTKAGGVIGMGEGAAGAVKWPFPLNTHIANTIGLFSTHRVYADAFNPDATVLSSLEEGAGEALTFAAVGGAASLTRFGASRLLKLPGVRALSAKWFPRLMGVGENKSMQAVVDGVKKFSARTLSDSVEKVMLAPALRETWRKTIDAQLLGMFMGAYAHASRLAEYQTASRSEKLSMFWRSMGSPEALATGLSFSLMGGLHYWGELRPEILRRIRETPEKGDPMLRMIAERLQHPDAGEDIQRVQEMFDRMAIEEPQFFQGFTVMTPEETRAAYQAGRAVAHTRAIVADRLRLRDKYTSGRVDAPPEGAAYGAMAFNAAFPKDAPFDPKGPVTIGEISMDVLRSFGFKSYRHLLSAVRQFLKATEAEPLDLRKARDIPVSVMRRMMDWRARGKRIKQLDMELAKADEAALHETLQHDPVPRRGQLELSDAELAALVRPRTGPEPQRDPPRPRPGQQTFPIAREGEPTMVEQLQREQRELSQDPYSVSMREAGELYAQVRGTKGYFGLDPLTAVEKAKSKRKRRPTSRQNALNWVEKGKKTVSWLKQQWPEAAKHVGARSDIAYWREAWLGALKRVDRERNAAQAYQNLVSEPRRLGAARSIQDIAAESNLEYHPDLHGITTESGRPVTRSKRYTDRMRAAQPGDVSKDVKRLKGAERGAEVKPGDLGKRMTKEGKKRRQPSELMSLDQFGEKLAQEGWFELGEYTVADVIDAIRSNKKHPSTLMAEETLAYREHERAMGERLDMMREAVERGEEPLPIDPFERGQMLESLFAGDPRFEGMTPERLERAILDLREEARAGSPNAVEESTPITAVDLARLASERFSFLNETLLATRVIPYENIYERHEIAAIMGAVANGTWPGLDNLSPKARAAVVQQARVLRATLRDTVVQMFKERNDFEGARKVSEMWRISEGDIKPEERDALREAGMLNADGLLNTALEEEMIWQAAQQAQQLLGESGLSGFQAGIIPIAFSARPISNPLESGPAAWFTWEHWMDKRPEFFRTPVGRALVKAGEALQGPLSGPATREIRTLRERWLTGAAMARGRAMTLDLQRMFAFAPAWERWGGNRPPPEDMRFLEQVIEDGTFAISTGPHTFEQIRRGTGYLWDVASRLQESWADLGQVLKEGGFLNEAQLEKLNKKFSPHIIIREQMASDAEELSRGEIPVGWLGHVMGREAGLIPDNEASFLLHDPQIAANQAGNQLTRLAQFGAILRMTVDSPLYTRTAAQMREARKKNPLIEDQYQVAAVPTDPPRGRSRLEHIDALSKTRTDPIEAVILGARLQSLREKMAQPGEAPTKGKFAYSEEIDNRIKYLLGESKDGKVYIEKGIAKELDLAMTAMFTLPEGDPTAIAARAVDTLVNWQKRNMVIFKPAQWLINTLSAIETNHVGGGVSRWDFLSSVTTGQGFHADAWSRAKKFFQWVSEGLQKEKPDHWTQRDWDEAMQAKFFFEAAGGSTYAMAALGPDLASALGAALDTPSLVREAVTHEFQRQATKRTWDDTQLGNLQRGIGVFSHRWLSQLEHVDAAIAKGFGSGNPAEEARSLGKVSSVWHVVELFGFKYAAYLRARHDHPDLEPARVLSYALSKTSDVRDTNPRLRRWLSMISPFQNKLWKAATTHARLKLGASLGFRGRFWTYPFTMIPRFLQWSMQAPLATASSAAMVWGVKGLIQSLFSSDEERKRWEEEMATAQRGSMVWDSADDERMAQSAVLRSVPMWGVGNIRLPDKAVSGIEKLMKQAWHDIRSRDPWAFRAPSSTGDEKTATLSDLTPAGFTLATIRRTADLATSGLGMLAGKPGKAEEFIGASERVMGLEFRNTIGALWGAFKPGSPLIDALGGKKTAGEAFVRILGQIGRSWAPELHPRLFFLSRGGQHTYEVLFLNGQTWNEWAAGINRFRQPESPGSRALDAAFYMFWPSRSLYQQDPVTADVDPTVAMLEQLYGDSYKAESPDGLQLYQAARWSQRQLSTMMADLYEAYFDNAADLAQRDVTFDEYVASAMSETFNHSVVLPDNETFAIEPGYVPESPLLKAIQNLPLAQQDKALGYIRRWAQQKVFTEQGVNMLVELGRRREIPKGIFRQAYANALRDPSGGELMRWWWDQVKDGDYEKVGRLAPLIWDVQAPAPNTDAHKVYAKIMDRYRLFGIDLPPLPESVKEQIGDVFGKQGLRIEMQGGKAFRRSLLEREPVNQGPTPLDALLPR